MRTAAAFVRLARPKFLLGGLAGFALGAGVASYAGTRITPGAYLAGQAMVTAFHLMTHFANDYFDRDADVHTRPTAFAGGSGVLVAGTLGAEVALGAALMCALVGASLAAAFAVAGNPAVGVLGLAIGLIAWCYSAPPLRLAGRGWGELATALVVAVLVPLTGFAAMTATVAASILAATLAPACATFAMMIAVEWPDRAADARTDKRNLIVRFGSPAMARLAGLGAWLIAPAMLATLAAGAPPSVAVFAALELPLAAGFARRIALPQAPADDVAAHGVTLFLVTMAFELCAYIAVLP